MNTRRYAAVLLLTMPGLAAGAQINKCMDASGKVVAYAAECPAGTRSEQTNIKNAPSAAPAPAQKSLAERDAEFRKRQMEKQEAATKDEKKSAEQAQRKRACDSARAYLKSLQEKQRITRTDPKTGERVFLEDAEYPKEIARAQQAVSNNCK
ncbi:MAG TPA: DUF4124 domain-containing protein [Burkholderiales bacterium]|nr:DUF4124 domain-containing protein [Burkholderiales bacterium]